MNQLITNYAENAIEKLLEAVQKVGKPDSVLVSEHTEIKHGFYVHLGRNRGRDVIEFTLVPMPGCCMYLISTGTIITGEYRGMGLSYALQDAKERLAKYWGYTKLVCTVTLDNEPELRVLKRRGWKKVEEGINKRTGNRVGMFVKDLYKEGKDRRTIIPRG